jgi:hypothetical protein
LPRFSKIIRGVRLSFGKASVPKRPFSREIIITFMDAARTGLLLDWRAALPLALCFQHLLRGAECFELNGSNVVRQPTFFLVEVESAKNVPEGFLFKMPIGPARSHCVGQFMARYIVKMGVKLGDKMSYFPCRVGTVKGVLKSTATTKVANLTMRASCKRLIEAAGLDPTLYASHSCKRGGALAAMPRSRFRIWGVGQALLWWGGIPPGVPAYRSCCPTPSGSSRGQEGARHPPWAVQPRVALSVWGSMESVASFLLQQDSGFSVEYLTAPLAPTPMAVLIFIYFSFSLPQWGR